MLDVCAEGEPYHLENALAGLTCEGSGDVPRLQRRIRNAKLNPVPSLERGNDLRQRGFPENEVTLHPREIISPRASTTRCCFATWANTPMIACLKHDFTTRAVGARGKGNAPFGDRNRNSFGPVIADDEACAHVSNCCAARAYYKRPCVVVHDIEVRLPEHFHCPLLLPVLVGDLERRLRPKHHQCSVRQSQRIPLADSRRILRRAR